MGRKTNYDISRQMQADLIDAYKRVSPHCWTQLEAYERMVREPAPRFYISSDAARRVLAPMVRGDFRRVDKMDNNKKEMYYALFEKVIELSEKREFAGKSLTYITPFAVLQPAPWFFISADRAKHIRTFMKIGIIMRDGRVDDTRLKSVARTRERYHRLKREREEAKKNG